LRRSANISKTTTARLTLTAALFAACGGLIQGFDTGGISNASQEIVMQFGLNPLIQGLVTSLVLVGAMVGAAFAGSLADAFGRRSVLIGCGVVFSVGVGLEVFAFSLPMLFGGRVTVGLAIGAASCISTLYISEISPPARRGGLLALFQLAVTAGIVCGIVIALCVGETAWRILLGAGIVPGLLLVGGMSAMPESPAWLEHRGLTAKAATARRFFGLPSAQPIPSAGPGLKLSAAFRSPPVQLALVAGIGMALIQQITGINAVMYYAPEIFKAAGFVSSRDAILDDLLLAVLLVVVTFAASRIVDRAGRRRLLLSGMAIMLVSLVVLGLAFDHLGSSPVVPWIILAGLLGYIAGFAIGPGPCIWLVIAEIYPMQIRGAAMGAATLFSWLANFFVSSTFPALSAGIGEANAFFLFAFVTLFSWLFTWAMLPETGGRTLDEIQEIWKERAATLFKHHTPKNS
jgi:sugar porter (SP) family MFS transporter